MKNLVLLTILLLSPFALFAQDEEQKEKPKDGWTKSGNVSLLFNQAAFNAEWQGGGISNIAGNGSLVYNMNYRKGKLSWDNNIIADYGLTKLANEDYVQKTNDRLELTSLIGKQIKETNWYYSGLLNFKTQFDSGFEETERTEIVNGEEITITNRTRITKFLSPAYLLVGPGIMWKKSDNLKVNVAPASARLVFVDGQFTDPNDPRNRLDANNAYFGVDAGDTLRFEFGAALNGYAKFKVMENITLENILALYSNYLEDPQNVDIDYTANLIMAVNEWIKVNLAFQAIYDDNAIQGFQIREALGIGVTYGL
ncbi:MAG: DUF3078 domain-containing protein [Bacteroidia bacterium]|nr:DUF3078 domain-containing protein [Bacteroidia bacterium]NNF30945.1 DUF3078 domain-containing protein [Flavobacteriaceae bacterium]MBT8275735.1 DUF3078 domain-containing protein [Bacteroidia bacterium]NNJ82352.1 DUF3078 domain-containing protein [Flavobacteriaceae bacterium]NNK54671.1 DUF3078 domain-containing protein [Flavobacteriaceae bacterium]